MLGEIAEKSTKLRGSSDNISLSGNKLRIINIHKDGILAQMFCFRKPLKWRRITVRS